jgi:ATP-binding cassette subfamily G (WHITE) protein 2 (SNQ2)
MTEVLTSLGSIFFLVVFTMTIAMKAFFRLIAAAFKQESSATSAAGIGVLIFSLYTGYTIPRPSIPGALRWITYLNVSSNAIS